MSYSYFILRTSCMVEMVNSDSAEFSLDELYSSIGCSSIEICRSARFDDLYLVVDDEGILNGLPLNIMASVLYGGDGLLYGDVVVGTPYNSDPHAEPDVYKIPQHRAIFLSHWLNRLAKVR